MTAVPSIAEIERDLERRHLWMPVTAQAELTEAGMKHTYIARIYRGRDLIATARRDTLTAAKRAAWEKVKEK